MDRKTAIKLNLSSPSSFSDWNWKTGKQLDIKNILMEAMSRVRLFPNSYCPPKTNNTKMDECPFFFKTPTAATLALSALQRIINSRDKNEDITDDNHNNNGDNNHSQCHEDFS